jgi:hypothetical protein
MSLVCLRDAGNDAQSMMAFDASAGIAEMKTNHE